MRVERFTTPAPESAAAALEVITRLTRAGHRALLAGGCVRDMRLGQLPGDYDVATSALPEQVAAIWRRGRLVGAQFGVVLVPISDQWIEVATFRSDGPYLDGRHPSHVRFSDEQQDAQRRDFSINGLFLDPARAEILDYVDGLADLDARVIRAIGDPRARFAEDHLRLIRAVRFAARLDYAIEPATSAAIRAAAEALRGVAAERMHDELRKILSHRSRAVAFDLLRTTDLLPQLWPDAAASPARVQAAQQLLADLPARASFESAFAAVVSGRAPGAIERICRGLAFSNSERETVEWLCASAPLLDDPAALSLAALKRLMAHAAFVDLCDLAAARRAGAPDAAQRGRTLDERVRAIAPDDVRPAPLITGDDLLARGLTPGPLFKRVLDELYTQQLNEQLRSRGAAVAALGAMLKLEHETD